MILMNSPAFNQSSIWSRMLLKIYHQMGSYLKLAYGAGVGESFDFDITEFSNAVKIPAKHVYRAIQILQQNGYLYFNEPMDRISTIHFTVDHETLYRFQVENKLKEPVIKMLLRMCPEFWMDMFQSENLKLHFNFPIPDMIL